jgi:ElaA protein
MVTVACVSRHHLAMNFPCTSRPTLRWRWCRFEALSLRELQFIYMARQQVFIIEQNCVYLDADGADETAHHLAAWAEDSPMPLAYARVSDPGVKYVEPSIGRVITTASARGTGLGRELLTVAVAQTVAAWPGLGIRISAQSHLEAFYQGFGFEIVSERYLEDGIPHTEMLRKG